MENSKFDLFVKGDMHRITDKIFLGDLSSSADEHFIGGNQITSVLNVCNHKNGNLQAGVHYAHMPMDDGPAATIHQLVAATRALDEMVNQGKTVLVHCLAGVSRSATVVALWLAWRYPVSCSTFDKAVNYVAKFRPCVDPNKHFLKVGPEALLELKKGT